MVQLKLGIRTADLPHSLRISEVTEEMFDAMVDEDIKAELLDGVMIVHSPASVRHDNVGGFLRGLMRIFARRKKRGVVLGPDSLVHLATCRKFAPDIFFVDQGRLPRPLPIQEWDGAPDKIVEILSPSNRDYDLEEKRPAFRDAGVKEIWFVDPDNQEIIIDRRQGKKYVTKIVSKGKVASSALTGFWIDAAWLWAEPLPDDLDCLQEILA